MAELHIADDMFACLAQIYLNNDAAKLTVLRGALADGERSGLADRNPFSRLRAGRE